MADTELVKKNEILLRLCSRWLFIKNKGKSTADYFITNHIATVAIYGCGELGKRLIEELEASCISVIVGIDQYAERLDAPTKVVLPTREYANRWNCADAIVITSPYFYNEIYSVMRTYGYEGQILALDDILMSI